MKKTAFLIFAALLVTGIIVWRLPGEQPEREETTTAIETNGVTKEEDKRRSFIRMKGLAEEQVLEELGEPDRQDLSEYGYVWWVYESKPGELFQLGMADGKVVTGVIFHKEEGDVRVGDRIEDVRQKFSIEDTFPVDSEGAYTMHLTEKDRNERPLIALDDKWSAQLYVDNVTEKVFAIRMIRNDFLLKHQPYKVLYRGTLPKMELLSKQDWLNIQKGMQKQIMTITNDLRVKNELPVLTYHQDAAEVAFSHSRDMNENNYFSHYSQNGDGLKERLGGIEYKKAGENIAAQYPDAVAAIHGWINSPGHRKALLDSEYTHLGVGVYKRYYTQNFLTLP
ncbi:CAP domain-containing protein [Halobacillus litoralis]|uniref:CAP domain-containing protein n=1 Tax=Halobacillus litoralis TaxID=45668 RepID=UPI001CFE9B6C|nr:CAP-associated domain-containing protein [Halobacillus litoralis]